MKHCTATGLWLVLVLLVSGCSTGRGLVSKSHPPVESIPHQVIDENNRLIGEQDTLTRGLTRNVQEPPPALVPVMPQYNPLDDHKVSFSIINEELQMVLISLARTVGMNIIIDPDLVNEKRLVTLNFQDVPASTVLDELLRIYDVYYEVKQNVIHIKGFEERIFALNFLDTGIRTSFDVGGDVLGAGGDTQASGLKGNFNIKGEGSKSASGYDVLDDTLKKVLSGKGKYALNRTAGSLYIKDTPAAISAVGRIVSHLREMLERQILIEARIIEVALSDGYTYGVDWTHLRNTLAQSSILNERLSWNIGSGLIINGGPGGTNKISAAVNALNQYGVSKIVSNPSIRTKHGQPSMISVGTSYTYKKSITTTKSAATTTTTAEDTTTIETGNVFDGLILGVIPFIEDEKRISLLINPIKSDVDKASLTPETVSTGNSISLPQVNIKEISTTIGVENNDVILLGGLIDHRHVSDRQGLPIISEIPFLSLLGMKDFKDEETRELVIVLKVTIL